MESLRFKVVDEAFNRKADPVEIPSERPEKYYGKYVFNRQKMFEYLPADTYQALCSAIDNKQPLQREVADSVAEGMKRWALDNGARHYTHWFQPLTETTAEKHDSFIEHDGKGGVIECFNGKLLVQQEPDASSFPNGGIRNTFEARGYSAWDISSPAFIIGNTLCIPTIFISYTGESLDYKTPLLRALNSVDKAATAVAKMFDPDVEHVRTYLGWEQEYFLVDESLYSARPDLMLTGRTLMGHESAKNQQLEDHYFGAIPSRVEAFMLDLEIECHKLGIPAKTRHNEVAPNQFELAPVFEEANLANDHNQLIMSVMAEVARRHHFRVLLHEKPFAGINGSGKHNNWSLGTDKGTLLFAPGRSHTDNLRFLTFTVNVMAAVHRHNALLKASIMSATNAHRLGANEAPPAIISIFMGSQIAGILERIEHSTNAELTNLAARKELELNLSQIPEIMRDNTDRNRTSPFAFTGNRFEFRAVGSSANCGAAMIALNAAVAEQLILFKKAVDERMASGLSQNDAILEEIHILIKSSKAIHFDGNGYSDEWKEEAARRGLDCETSVPLIFDAYQRKSSVDMFRTTGVFSEVELAARNEVKWEMYTKKVQIEARVLGDLAINHVIPVATQYQSILLDNVLKMRQVFGIDRTDLTASVTDSIEKLTQHITVIREEVAAMVDDRRVANRLESEREKALAYHDRVVPHMDTIRYHIDKLELMVDNEMWPLPKYRELLFIR
ncbi:glutamine synthetase III [Paramuribaculum intestinale]|uniref:Glutamine synthetase type III n=2 Tax=Paramuribaculum intestinale TaxID=2094151 RepID=A0A2V1J1S4_9BACT|nr:glutamine synthetase III [Paramuribaculum intestinale]MBJ2186156.1 glutamine synthetase III [Muribaculaceae bacterium]ROS93745.1 glutamine synthetase type III [Muribaculaceae bacterium Isolate-043 (Harlan)]PWB09431.1 glutamine synthetase type III [Paramuribaculum intestinale]PWB12669.1 glutamine synthetase type III [Paramuribaculum intestinale]WLT41440.1 glutamine synthetase III [Paramuribaculum intestinale]